MEVTALKNIIVGGVVRDKGETFEVATGVAHNFESKGFVSIVGGAAAVVEDIEAADGLPSLEEEASARKKRK